MTTDHAAAQPHTGGKPRARRLKTWTAFGDLGRRPSEYEILTHGLNHTTGQPPLELGPEVHGNRWLAEHRDATGLKVTDWNAFRDPDAVTYGSYVAMQDDQETYVEGLLEQFDRENHDAQLADAALDFLALTVTPGRYLVHAEQMLSAYIQQLAPSSYVATAATFQTADQLRRVQLTAYRTTQLRLTYPQRTFGTAERATWEQHPGWQPVREAVEHALVEFDWDRAVVATQLVTKPVADLLFLQQLGQELATAGATLDGLIAENLWRDAQRSQRWTGALLRFLADADPGNVSVLQGHLRDWSPRGHAMAAAGSELLAQGGGRSAAKIAAAVTSGWRELVEPVPEGGPGMNRSPAQIGRPSEPDGARAVRGYAITVTDAENDAAFSCPPGETVLFAGQAAGWDLPYECASGGCGTCRAQLLGGEVISSWPDATGLTERDRWRGNRILLCQSRPAAPCTLRSQTPLRRLRKGMPHPRRHEARITRMDLLTPDMMILEVDCGQPVPYLAGQFVILEMPDGARRPYSMSGLAGPPSARLELLIRNKPGGVASGWLFQQRTLGSQLTVEGPYGRAHAQSPAGRPVLCVAGGSGLGQVLTIAEHCLAQDATRPLSFYYGARSVADLVLSDRFSVLRSRGAAVIAVAETTEAGTGRAGKPGQEQGQKPGWGAIRPGLVVDAVAADHGDLTGHDLYVAGPAAMVDALLAALVRTGRAAADRVFFDRFWT